MGLTVVYRGCCPRCGGDISSAEMSKGCCSNCLSEGKGLATAIDVLGKEVESLSRFFTMLTGFTPWALQVHWMKRLVAGESFAMVAPTGIGKSTLLAVYALYRAHFYKSKVYIITPTREIAKQMYNKVREFIEVGKIGDVKLLFYDSASKGNNAVANAIRNGEFDILITSAAFLSRRHDLVMDKRFDIVIADDLDSIMKSSKSVDKVLKLLGFTDEDIELALKIVKLRRDMLMAKASKSQELVEKIRRELVELEASLRNNIAKRNVQLVVASATGRVRGLKAQVLKLLLGFDAGAVFEYWRNVVDVYHEVGNDIPSLVVELVKKLGSGIVFVSPLYKEIVGTVVEALRNAGIKVEVAKSGNRAVDKFRRGEVDVVIGSASYYGILVRGVDEPVRTRYTMFIGIPSIVKDAWESLNNPRFLYSLLCELRSIGCDVERQLETVANIIMESTPSMLYLYARLMRQGLECESLDRKIVEKVKQLAEIKMYAYEVLKEVVEKVGTLNAKKFVVIKKGKNYLVIRPDPYTYIQASGRCSRLFRGSKTFGISIIFEKHLGLVTILEEALRRFIPNFSIIKLNLSDLDQYIRKIEISRSGGESARTLDIATALIVVESPTKVKTIANMFGRPVKRIVGSIHAYETLIPLNHDKMLVATVIPSFGHITDLVIDEGLHGVKVDKGRYIPIYDFITRCRTCNTQHVGIYDRCPYCESLDVFSSASVYNVMRVLASQVDLVLIGTDPDTEGEKIAYDIYNLLLPYNKNIYRIEFREVTKTAILEALRNPRGIDLRRVEAQVVRRISDRWIGFEVSTWLQIKFDKPWLGAGRVQSPVLLWVSSRYKGYRDGLGYAVVADIGGYKVKFYVGKGAEARERAYKLVDKIKQDGLEIVSMNVDVKELAPPPPFTTDSLLYDANIRLGFSASKTMALAQTLFELGLITYHRTDSTRISALGIAIAREALEKLHLGSMFIPRSWGGEAQEGAHEAIRPTSPISAEELIETIVKGELGFLTRIGEEHLKLYELIFRRFIASQMTNAAIKCLSMELKIDDFKARVEIPIEVVTPGFTLVYPVKLYNGVLKNIDTHADRLRVTNATVAKASNTTLYRVADVIKMMKDKGIGRPSTYAKAIDNNLRHGYIVISKKRGVLVPTKLGLEVAEALSRHFLSLVGENVTKELEELIDRVEIGMLDANNAIEVIRRNIDNVMRIPDSSGVPATEGAEASAFATA